MASANTLSKNVLNVKTTVVENCKLYTDHDGVKHLLIKARPNKWHENECPFCHKKCSGYDKPTKSTRTWRGLDFGAILVEIEGTTHRVVCPEHGIVTADVPWAFPGSSFTKDFDRVACWLARYLPQSVVSEFMRVDWKTVGRCVDRAFHEIEPRISRRLDGLVNIGIDETSYKKGHKYITVVVNHDTNTVVWASPGHGKAVLEKFYRLLTPEQLSRIRVTTGDGARWITACVEEFTPICERCVDPFHVVEWAMEALDKVRREAWRTACSEANALAKEHPQGKGRPKRDDADAARIAAAREKADMIKGSAYALGKAPENLTENQKLKIKMIAVANPRVYRAYKLKEELRMILKIIDVEEAEKALNSWLWKASHSRIPAMYELNLKIRRHKKHILNAIRFKMSNARIEAINNKIKLIIRKAYGFRNIDNMISLIYLVCSDLHIPLPNRKCEAA